MNKGMKIGLGIYTALLAIDIILFFLAGPIAQYVEINPLYRLGGGLLLPILLNILLMGFMLWRYNKNTNPFSRFSFILVICSVCLVRLVVIISNINVLLHPPTMVEAMVYYEATKNVVVQPEVVKLVWTNMIPYLSGAMAYLLFSQDHKVEVKNARNK